MQNSLQISCNQITSDLINLQKSFKQESKDLQKAFTNCATCKNPRLWYVICNYSAIFCLFSFTSFTSVQRIMPNVLDNCIFIYFPTAARWHSW